MASGLAAAGCCVVFRARGLPSAFVVNVGAVPWLLRVQCVALAPLQCCRLGRLSHCPGALHSCSGDLSLINCSRAVFFRCRMFLHRVTFTASSANDSDQQGQQLTRAAVRMNDSYWRCMTAYLHLYAIARWGSRRLLAGSILTCLLFRCGSMSARGSRTGRSAPSPCMLVCPRALGRGCCSA